jgi:hypothetical protein
LVKTHNSLQALAAVACPAAVATGLGRSPPPSQALVLPLLAPPLLAPPLLVLPLLAPPLLAPPPLVLPLLAPPLLAPPLLNTPSRRLDAAHLARCQAARGVASPPQCPLSQERGEPTEVVCRYGRVTIC